MGLYHVELRSKPQSSPGEITLTLVETRNQQLSDIEKVDSKDEFSWLKWRIYNGRRKICINFQTDADKVNIVVYRYRKNTYLKHTEMGLKLTGYQKLRAKLVKLVHKVIDVVDRPNGSICVTLRGYKADNPETSYAQIRRFGRKKEEEKFQQVVSVNYKLDEFVYLLDVMNSVYDKVIANQPISNVYLLIYIDIFYKRCIVLDETTVHN